MVPKNMFRAFFLKFWGKMCATTVAATTVATCFPARLLVREHGFNLIFNLIIFLGTQQ